MSSLQTKTEHATRRASVAQAKSTIATAKAAISQLRAHGVHPKNSVEGAERDVTIAQHDLAVAVARLDIARIKSELPLFSVCRG